MPADRRRHALARILHLARLLAVSALIWILLRNATQGTKPGAGAALDPQQWEGSDAGSQLVSTSPLGDRIHGWAGPSEVWLELDASGVVRRAKVANSADSASFVERIAHDVEFLSSLRGMSAEQAAEWSVDAVSGATLTSRAIQAAVRARFSGSPLPHPFDALSPKDLDPLPGGFTLRGEALGGVGYQGPTDAVLHFAADGRVVELRILNSFDNQRWVEDIGFERSFFTHFVGMTLEDLAAQTVGPQGVEGVSGATMTSQGIVLSLQAAAAKSLQARAGKRDLRTSFARTPRELLGWILGGVALLVLLSPLRRRRRVRSILRVAVMIGFGVGAGALLSLDSAWAWAQHGLPWQSAPLLAGFVLASVIGPAVLGRKTYCRSLCAHGAMQQLLAPRARRKLTPKLEAVLRRVPHALLFLAVALLARGSVGELASWEPFAAWSPQAASLLSVLLLLASVVAAQLVPLAYCHYACPTGALLDYLRYQPKRLGKRADLGLLVLLGLAMLN
jgi:NosR/NirI family transcriptional regulator, nitrous oxide reductase regulator